MSWTEIPLDNQANPLAFRDGWQYAPAPESTDHIRIDDKYDLCDTYCERMEECYPEEAVGCEIDCLCELRYAYNHSQECERAYADGWKCLLALSCEEIEAFFIDWSNHVCTAAMMDSVDGMVAA